MIREIVAELLELMVLDHDTLVGVIGVSGQGTGQLTSIAPESGAFAATLVPWHC